MLNGNGEGNTAGNRQINANTGVTIGLALAVFIATGTAIYKAGEVVTNIDNLKSKVADLSVEIIDVRRTLQRIERQNIGAITK